MIITLMLPSSAQKKRWHIALKSMRKAIAYYCSDHEKINSVMSLPMPTVYNLELGVETSESLMIFDANLE
jgi:hypothetical protein